MSLPVLEADFYSESKGRRRLHVSQSIIGIHLLVCTSQDTEIAGLGVNINTAKNILAV